MPFNDSFVSGGGALAVGDPALVVAVAASVIFISRFQLSPQRSALAAVITTETSTSFRCPPVSLLSSRFSPRLSKGAWFNVIGVRDSVRQFFQLVRIKVRTFNSAPAKQDVKRLATTSRS